MQNLVLGALLDLTEDARAVPHVVTWRGTGQKTAVSLLIELWRAEEQAMGVKRDRNHVMTGGNHMKRSKTTVLHGGRGLPPYIPSHPYSG